MSNIEQVLATTPHETPTIRPLASHHKNYTSERSLIGLNTEFFFSKFGCNTKVKKSNLLIAGGKIVISILFSRVLELWEMQTASSKVWTKVTVFVSLDDNLYTLSTSNHINNRRIPGIAWNIKIDSVYKLILKQNQSSDLYIYIGSTILGL